MSLPEEPALSKTFPSTEPLAPVTDMVEQALKSSRGDDDKVKVEIDRLLFCCWVEALEAEACLEGGASVEYFIGEE